jgi:hypothetical protein
MPFRLKEDIQPFGKAKASFEYRDPSYATRSYEPTSDWLIRLRNDSELAVRVIADWKQHFSQFLMYVQFKDDVGQKRSSLNGHTRLVSLYCDSEISVDTQPLYEAFHSAYYFATIHEEYREDSDRDANYEKHRQKLHDNYTRLFKHDGQARQLIQRICLLIEARSTRNQDAEPTLREAGKSGYLRGRRRSLKVFYSYSHRDEELRDQLEKHLSALRREGVIAEWHDRKITAGSEWKGDIDAQLEEADVILVLVSADFLGSEYCCDVEMKRAMERHQHGYARVIPVIIRACDWKNTLFADIQSLPTDGKPVTSWVNTDEAFVDVVQGIRAALVELNSH